MSVHRDQAGDRTDAAFDRIERENQPILRAAGEGIYGVNADGRTTFVNPAAERMLGWTAEELVGRDMHSLVHHSHPDGSHYADDTCPIYAAFRDGAIRHVENEKFFRKDGQSFWVEYTSTPIRDNGVLIGAVIVFRDVSQRRDADEKLRAAHEEVDRLRKRLELENAYLQEQIRIDGNHYGIIGRSAAIQKTLSQVALVAPTDATVLIAGESGTGKELVARAIHEDSRRANRPLIRVNCAAIPVDLFESEFFGHAKGAFVGALRDRIGRFELADGGTLFLDEIGEIPVPLQGKLLRVLQEGQFERVGEARTRRVDVRVIAATNRDLKALARRGSFREDLYFRSTSSPSNWYRCANAWMTFRFWLCTSCARPARSSKPANCVSRKAMRGGFPTTHGPAMCASCRTSSSAPLFSRETARSVSIFPNSLWASLPDAGIREQPTGPSS